MKNVRMIFVMLFAMMSMAAECVQAEGRMPKLVVGIVVDQMRWDYLERYVGRWGEGGFRRLMEEGYGYDNAYLCYVPTVTAVGHASVYTGTTPAIHGIAGNNFFVDGRKCYCTDDHEVRTVGTDTRAGGMERSVNW
ncbi:MAG: alkaline phosphatase family protein [Prevotella sp.]|nr:alkaline phosphatase family protein [Prevotella sp.]